MLPWTEIVKKETWVYNLKCSDYKHQLPTDHVEFSNKKCEVIHSNNKKKNYQKSHDEAWFQKNIWLFWILIKFSTTCIKTLNFVNVFYIFLFLIFYLHFFAFMCVYFNLHCLISNKLKVYKFVFKTLSPWQWQIFFSEKFRNNNIFNDNLYLSLSAYLADAQYALPKHKHPNDLSSSPQKCVLTIFINTISAFTLPPSIDHKFKLWPFHTFQYIISID